METKLYKYTFFLGLQPLGSGSRERMFELFKLLEMFDGKIVLSADELSPDEITYLAEYKVDLNEKIAAETEARRRQIDTEINSKRNTNSSVDVNSKDYQKNLFNHVTKRQRL